MTIAQIIGAGSGSTIGPVTIDKIKPTEFGKSPKRWMMIKDSSHPVAYSLVIWGPAANAELAIGELITLHGKITHKEYPEGSGKWKVDVNDATIVKGDARRAAVQAETVQSAYQAPAYSPPVTVSRSMDEKMLAVAGQSGKFNRMMMNANLHNGFTEEQAFELTKASVGLFPLWWFGEKGI